MMTTPFLLRINYYINIINIIKLFFILIKDFPGSSVVKNPSANTGDIGDEGLIPRSGRSPGGGNGNPLQYSWLENPHRWRSLVGYSPWGCKESGMT